jgi:hypothetical protein
MAQPIPPGFIRVVSVEKLMDPLGTNDLFVVFYETANGPGSIVLSPEHAAELNIQKAEEEDLLIPLPSL